MWWRTCVRFWRGLSAPPTFGETFAVPAPIGRIVFVLVLDDLDLVQLQLNGSFTAEH